MKKLKKYIADVIIGAVLAVLFVVVSLDAISDLVNQLGILKEVIIWLRPLFMFCCLYHPIFMITSLCRRWLVA